MEKAPPLEAILAVGVYVLFTTLAIEPAPTQYRGEVIMYEDKSYKFPATEVELFRDAEIYFNNSSNLP